MIIMKYSLSMKVTTIRASDFIGRMYGMDISVGLSLWMTMKLTRVYNGGDTMMITIDEDEFGDG